MKLIALFLCLIFSPAVFSQSATYQGLDSLLKHVEANNLGVGAVSVYKGGKEVFHRSFGQQNIPTLRNKKNSRYHVGSITKLVTAVLLFKLIEDGKLKLDDKLANFYPKMPNSEKITLENMLEHSSGLGSYVVKDGDVWVTEKVSDSAIFNLIIQQGVSFEPNEDVAYSNSAYYLLAKIVERKYGKPFHAIFNHAIAAPLQLKNFASIQSNPKHVLKPYHFVDTAWKELDKEIDFLNVIGVGDMVATPTALNVFINQLFHHKIIKAETLALMLPVLGKESWGRGIAIWEFDGTVFYGHGGDTLGSHALVIYNKDDDLSIAYTSNAERIDKEAFVRSIVASLYHSEFILPTVN